MDITKQEVAALQAVLTEGQMEVLDDLELALVGGGVGDIILG